MMLDLADSSPSVSAAILVIMSGISLIFDITAIILLARQKLTPVTYLVFQCIKAAFWTYIFVGDMIAVANYGIPGLALLFSVVLFATSIGQLIYGSVIMHRKRAGKLLFRGNYSGVESGHLAGHESPPRGSYAAYNPHGMPPGPFRDPSPDRAPSPAPSSSTAQQSLHPAFKQSGAASDHYDATAAQQSYEMQNTAYRAS